MDRRDVLKKLSLALGCTIATPTLLNLLSSCTQKETDWKPSFLSDSGRLMVDFIVDIILPKSEIPGGVELNSTKFIDTILCDVKNSNEQFIFRQGSIHFANKFKELFNKKASIGRTNEYYVLLERYFNLSKQEEEKVFQLLEMNLFEISEDKKETYLIYKFLTDVRYYSLLCFSTSQSILEGVMGYKSIPGTYKGCTEYN